MKKLILLLLLVCLFLTGCTSGNMLTVSNNDSTVSSLGFDFDGKDVTVIFEAITVNSDDSDKDIDRKLYKGKGKTVRSAVKKAKEKATQKLPLSHVATFILGNGIEKKQMHEIYDYCYDNNDISVAVAFVKCESAEALLKTKPVSSLTVGYDIASMLDTYAKSLKKEYKNRFYQSGIEAEKKEWELPFFKVINDSFYISGTKKQNL